MTAPLIRYHNVTVLRKKRRVLDRLTFQIPTGQHVAILGPNGCGKSTLIKTITRELYPDPDERDSSLEILGQRVWNIFALRPLLGIVSYDWLETCRRNNYPCREIILSGFFGSVGIWPNHIVTEAMERRTTEVTGGARDHTPGRSARGRGFLRRGAPRLDRPRIGSQSQSAGV